ncbi:hypothetical protein RSOL_378930, partial [Rhizoctonia solani AG-3 Rhs1AP]
MPLLSSVRLTGAYRPIDREPGLDDSTRFQPAYDPGMGPGTEHAASTLFALPLAVARPQCPPVRNPPAIAAGAPYPDPDRRTRSLSPRLPPPGNYSGRGRVTLASTQTATQPGTTRGVGASVNAKLETVNLTARAVAAVA